jgi:hypothetical protein
MFSLVVWAGLVFQLAESKRLWRKRDEERFDDGDDKGVSWDTFCLHNTNCAGVFFLTPRLCTAVRRAVVLATLASFGDYSANEMFIRQDPVAPASAMYAQPSKPVCSTPPSHECSISGPDPYQPLFSCYPAVFHRVKPGNTEGTAFMVLGSRLQHRSNKCVVERLKLPYSATKVHALGISDSITARQRHAIRGAISRDFSSDIHPFVSFT